MTQQTITTDDANEAWARGYKEGYNDACIGNHNPPIPPLPGGYPPGVDPKDYYYKEGKEEGFRNGLHTNAGIKTPE